MRLVYVVISEVDGNSKVEGVHITKEGAVRRAEACERMLTDVDSSVYIDTGSLEE